MKCVGYKDKCSNKIISTCGDKNSSRNRLPCNNKDMVLLWIVTFKLNNTENAWLNSYLDKLINCYRSKVSYLGNSCATSSTHAQSN